MKFNNIEEIAHELRTRGDDWADKNAAASILEDITKSILSEEMLSTKSDSVAASEKVALRSQRYKDHLVAAVEARRVSNRAKVAFDTFQRYVDLYQTQQATKRVEMQKGL